MGHRPHTGAGYGRSSKPKQKGEGQKSLPKQPVRNVEGRHPFGGKKSGGGYQEK